MMNCKSNIPDFYRDRSVFITGGTGFLGKVLVEKLLRSCPDIKVVYLLMRSKKGQDIRDRLIQEFHKNIMFEKLVREQPEVMTKIIPVEGDISLPNLGLSGANLQLLLDNVSLVFNSAATIRFNEDLRTAVQLNVRGPQQLLHICRQMQKLAALVHVSTAFNNLDKEKIEEIVYQTPISPTKLMKIVDILDDENLGKITDNLVGRCPNTYTFTKGIAEQLLKEEHGDIPLVIVRPSIVTAAMKEPMPGWVDNMNGPTGMIYGAGRGVLKVARVNPQVVGDMIPVDLVINLMISVAWYTALTFKPKDEVKVFTSSTGQHNPMTWGQFSKYSFDLVDEFPGSNVLWYPSTSYLPGKYTYKAAFFLYHYVPAYIVDFIALLMGKKTQFVRLCDKVDGFVTRLCFFSTQQWKFVSNNCISLLNHLSVEDRRTFYFDVRQIDWKSYTYDYCFGVRRYIEKEKDDTIPAARIRLRRIYWLRKATHFLILFVIAFILFRFFQ